eukprot:Colp12_sorted_trinity150504_noHs@25693
MRFNVIVLLALAIWAGHGFSDEVEEEFERFMVKYNKTYNSPEEYEKRLENFRVSLHRHVKLNAEATNGAKFGINVFSDLSAEEFQAHFTSSTWAATTSEKAKRAYITTNGPLPDNFDWRRHDPNPVTAVRDQKQCGSCWALTAAETVESAAILAGLGSKLLSEQQLISCDNQAAGCLGGDFGQAFRWISENGGLAWYEDFPFYGGVGRAPLCPSNLKKRVAITQYGLLPANETVMMQSLVKYGPLAVAVNANTWHDYVGGVIQRHCEPVQNHAVQIVGYDVRGPVKFWIVRNSWSGGWGDGGYAYIAMGSNLCGIDDRAFFV